MLDAKIEEGADYVSEDDWRSLSSSRETKYLMKEHRKAADGLNFCCGVGNSARWSIE